MKYGFLPGKVGRPGLDSHQRQSARSGYVCTAGHTKSFLRVKIDRNLALNKFVSKDGTQTDFVGP